MRIVSLEERNIKRISAVEITPDGNLVVLGGANGAGKTSILDGIEMALAGGRAIPDRPLRKGAKTGKVVLDLGEYTVRRTFTAAGGTNLTITAKDGSRFPSPQAMLDKITGQLAFDPLAFVAQKPDEQLETLKRLVGLDFTQAEAERQRLYDRRREVNLDVKNLQAQLAGIPEEPDVPDAEASIADLLVEKERADELNAANQAQRDDIEVLTKAITRGHEEIKKAKAEIDKWQQYIEERATGINTARERRANIMDELEHAQDIDTAAIQERIAGAEQTNRRVRAQQQRRDLVAKHNAAEVFSKDLTTRMDKIDTDKAATLEGAEFPVAGLSFDDSSVLYNGIPFPQASSSEQLRVSVAIGAALNPTLRVILVRNGNDLDGDGLKLLAGFAAEKDMQVWVERIAGGGGLPEVIIEDGQVVSDAQESQT